jgi:bifunctional UDP-N-acetylglucosamine pyrophosphorylase/glucosamine-1-phosphate N-acetyltransferase
VAAPVVVILAAGQGTRMRSEIPKLLHPICGWPMIVWSVEAARLAGAERVVVVQSPDRELEAVLDGDVELAIQNEPRGTADAVRAAASHLAGVSSVVVVNGDHPLTSPETLSRLAEAQSQSGAAATVATAILEDPGAFGRVIRAPDGTVERIVEAKRPGDASELELQIREISTGIWAFDTDELITALDQVGTDNSQGEMYLPEVVPILRQRERSVVALEVTDEGAMLGINDRAALVRARALAQAQIHHRHLLAGVTIVDPAATVIDAGVAIAQDALIAPFSSLHGDTTIGPGSTIGPLSTLVDTLVGEDSTVVHSYVKGAEIGDRVSVGPFAYLRPGTVMREGSKAGTFVEIKNSDIGAGTKVPHLSYIGDADIGERSNLGASTITANYDGAQKHRTTIGSGVKTSVDTTLVAPVTVGDDAYTAAGSVITKDVPPGGLGVARARQENIEDYAERRKERDAEASEEQTS